MLKIPDRAKQLRLNTVHKIYYNKAPSYLNAKFKRSRDRAHLTRRSERNFINPQLKGTESNTFYFSAIKDWNSLPEDLKTCENIASFKKGDQKTPDADGGIENR